MTNESITVTFQVRTGAEFAEEEYRDVQRVEQDLGVHLMEAWKETMDFSEADRREDMIDQAAAEA